MVCLSFVMPSFVAAQMKPNGPQFRAPPITQPNTRPRPRPHIRPHVRKPHVRLPVRRIRPRERYVPEDRYVEEERRPRRARKSVSQTSGKKSIRKARSVARAAPVTSFKTPELPKPRPLFAFGVPVLLDQPKEDDRLVVVIKEDDSDQVSQSIASQNGLQIEQSEAIPLLDAQIVRMALPPGQDLEATMRQVIADARVLAVQPDYQYSLQEDEIRQDVVLSAGAGQRQIQYAVDKLHLPEVHALSRGQNIRVAVIDSRVDFEHPEFTGRQVKVQSAFQEKDSDPDAHGTAISGLILASKTLIGAAPDVDLYAIEAFRRDQNGRMLTSSYSIVKALSIADEAKVRVINMSFAGPLDPLVFSTMDKLAEKNIILIAAAGNNGPDALPAYPAAHKKVIAVTAIDAKDQLFSGANRGDYIALAAPGVDIIAPAPKGSYGFSSGTSLATAYVSGVAALMLSLNPDLSNSSVESLLYETADDIGPEGFDEETGKGFINAPKAVASVKSYKQKLAVK
jgi:subtilisin family serine protease